MKYSDNQSDADSLLIHTNATATVGLTAYMRTCANLPGSERGEVFTLAQSRYDVSDDAGTVASSGLRGLGSSMSMTLASGEPELGTASALPSICGSANSADGDSHGLSLKMTSKTAMQQ